MRIEIRVTAITKTYERFRCQKNNKILLEANAAIAQAIMKDFVSFCADDTY